MKPSDIKFDLPLNNSETLRRLDDLKNNLSPELSEHFQSGKLAKIIETQIGQFIARDDGTALDTKTGLTWCRFSIGQRWENGTVSGDATEMDWGDAMKVGDSFKCGGFTDWRLPTRDELKSIVKSGASNPSIDTTCFPNTPSDWFWSASVYANYLPNSAWIVYFYGGVDDFNFKNDNGAVRLVRGGQSF